MCECVTGAYVCGFLCGCVGENCRDAEIRMCQAKAQHHGAQLKMMHTKQAQTSFF